MQSKDTPIDQVELSLDCKDLAKSSSGELLMERSAKSVQDRPVNVLLNAFQALKKDFCVG